MAGMRISGLATGMDIDSIVKDMVRAKRIPYDKMSQKKQTLEWKRDQYREMNTLLLKLREDTLNMRLPSRFLTKTTTTSNESKITATADATAGNTTYTFNKVDRLASAATNASKESISTSSTNRIDPKASIYSLREKLAATNDEAGLAAVDTNFNWQNTAADGVDETVKVSSAGKSFKLAKLSGGAIQSIENAGSQIQVKKADGTDGDLFTITTDKADLNKLEENQVYVDQSTGQVTFGKEVAAGSSFDISYKYIQKDSLSVSEGQTEFQLSNAGIKGNEGVKFIKITAYQKNADGTIKKGSDGKALEDSSKSKEYSTSGNQTDPTFLNYNSSTNTYTSNDGKVTIKGNTGELTYTEADKGSKIEASYSYSFFEINMTAHTSKGPVKENIKINGGDSFNSILDKISKSDLGISAFYDEYADKVTLTRTETGDFNKNEYAADGIERTAHNQEVIFGVDSTEDLFLKKILKFDEAEEKGGEDAKFTLNGLDTGRNSNTFTVNGVTFTLKDTVSSGSPIMIGSTTDTEKVYENIKTFIDQYNETIDKINKKIGEEYHRDYQPLTKEERESLSEDEIKLWEEKAKSGLLRRDQSLTNVLDKMRNDFYSPVSFEGNSTYSQLTSIGIKTTNLYNVNKGKLEIDEDKLKEAIANDPEAVYQLFAADGDSFGEKGIARRLRESLTTAITGIESTAGNDIKTNSQFTIGKNLDDLTDRMTSFERRLQDFEDRYYKQFTAMEKAIQQMNQQSSYMMQQLGAWTAQ